jgi:hypothetical protein
MARSAAARQPSRAPAHAPRHRPRTRPVVVHRQRRRRRLRRRWRLGFAVIPMIAVLFAGVIFANSMELGLIKQQGAVAKHTIEVQGQIDSLQALKAHQDLVVRNRAASLGFVRPPTSQIGFIEVRPIPAP